jgi:nuclear GTP-binding protein
MPEKAVATTAVVGDDVEMSNEVGDAKILNNLSEAFTIDGLFDTLNDEAAWEGEEDLEDGPAWEAEEIAEAVDLECVLRQNITGLTLTILSQDVSVAPAIQAPLAKSTRFALDDSDASDMSDDEDDENQIRPPPPQRATTSSAPAFAPTPFAPAVPPVNTLKRPAGLSLAPMFTKEELAVLPPGVIDRQKLKQQAKKAKKRQEAKEKTEGELMYGMMGMDVEQQEPINYVPPPRLSAKQLRKEKQRAKAAREKEANRAALPSASASTSTGGMELDEDLDRKKEADFANFLATVGGGE